MAIDKDYFKRDFQAVSEELPKTMHRFLRLSDKPEDTYVAGLSMGGYGAMRLALTYPERFAAAASFSGAVDIMGHLKNLPKERRLMWENVFGDPEKLLPEADALEYASHYRSRKALPLVEKLKALALSLYRKLQDLRRDFRALQSKFDSVSHDRDIYKRRWEKARDENEALKAELADYDSVKQELGPVQLQAVLSRSKARREEKAARKVQKRPQQTRPGQDAR